MEKEKLDSIMQSLEGTSIRECEITSKGSSVRLVRNVTAVPAAPAPLAAAPSSAEPVNEEASEPVNPCNDILSGWVGHFYRGASKDSKPLVKLRDKIKEGQQVGIVITMNVVHQIVSTCDGKITDFLVEDGQAVEYDQPLMRLSDAD